MTRQLNTHFFTVGTIDNTHPCPQHTGLPSCPLQSLPYLCEPNAEQTRRGPMRWRSSLRMTGRSPGLHILQRLVPQPHCPHLYLKNSTTMTRDHVYTFLISVNGFQARIIVLIICKEADISELMGTRMTGPTGQVYTGLGLEYLKMVYICRESTA